MAHMSGDFTLLLAASLLAFLTLTALTAHRDQEWRRFLAQDLPLALVATTYLYVTFGFPYPSSTVAKGGPSEIRTAGALFLAVLVGAISSGFAQRFSLPRNKRIRTKFDIAPLVQGTIFSVPIYLTLLGVLLDLNADLSFGSKAFGTVLLIAWCAWFSWRRVFSLNNCNEKP